MTEIVVPPSIVRSGDFYLSLKVLDYLSGLFPNDYVTSSGAVAQH